MFTILTNLINFASHQIATHTATFFDGIFSTPLDTVNAVLSSALAPRLTENLLNTVHPTPKATLKKAQSSIPVEHKLVAFGIGLAGGVAATTAVAPLIGASAVATTFSVLVVSPVASSISKRLTGYDPAQLLDHKKQSLKAQQSNAILTKQLIPLKKAQQALQQLPGRSADLDERLAVLTLDIKSKTDKLERLNKRFPKASRP